MEFKKSNFINANAKPYFCLLIILLIAYLPLSSFYFGMKNDAFSDNFPDKYFLSQALHAGILPLWNPYMNFGFPIYADPGFAYWSPVTWLFTLIGYNTYTLTFEVLLYLYIAGVCMFNLCRHLKFSSITAITVAAMYMCSGFFVGSIQYINFITAAAFLPFLLQSVLHLFELPSIKTSVKFSLAFLCVIIGGHPAIPVASVYFILILFLLFCLFRKKGNYNLKKAFLYFFIGLILLLILIAPLIYSYTNIWSFYGRNHTQQSFEIKNTGIDFASLISLLFPFSTTAHSNIFYSDVAMRNLYFSLFGFFSLVFAFKQKNKLVRIFFISGICMLVLSAAGNFKTTIYNFLPGLNYIRTNGEFRIFTILLFTVISGYGIESILNNKSNEALLRKFTRGFLMLCTVVFVLLVIFNFQQLVSFCDQLRTSASVLVSIKTFLDNENLLVAFLISLLIAIVLLFTFLVIRINIRKKIFLFITLDVIINAIIYLPITGIGTVTLPQIQSIYNSNPTGIPIPELIPVNKIDTLDARTTGLVGDITYYNKKIGTQKRTDYPSYFTTTDNFFKSSQTDFVLSKPYIFFKTEDQHFRVINFSGQKITINVDSKNDDTLYYLQNNYKYWKAFNNGKKVPVSTAFTTFMSVPVHKGFNKIEFIYSDKNLKYFFLVSIIALIASIVFVARKDKPYQASTTSVLLT